MEQATDGQTGWRLKAEVIAGLIILAGAYSQSRVGLDLPVATLILAVGGVAIVFIRGKFRWPQLRWPQVLFLCLVSLGLLGLSRADLKGSVRELIQLGEIFLISWYLFATWRREAMKPLLTGLGVLSLILVLAGVLKLYQFPPFDLSEARHAALLVIGFPFLILALRRKKWWLLGALALSALVLGLGLKNAGLLLCWGVTAVLTALLLDRKLAAFAGGAVVLALGLSLAAPGKSAWDSLNPRYDRQYRKRLFIEYSASLLAPKYYPAGGGLGEYKRSVNSLKQYLEDQPSPGEEKIPRDSNNQYLLTMVEAGLPAAAALLLLFGAGIALPLLNLKNLQKEEKEAALAVACAAAGLLLAGLFSTVLGRGIGIWTGAVLGLSWAVLPKITRTGFAPFALRLAMPALCVLSGLGIMVLVNRETDELEHVSRVNRSLRAGLFGVKPEDQGTEGEFTESGLRIIRLTDVDEPVAAGTIRVEGEDYVRVTGFFRTVRANDASGNKALEIPNDTGKGVGEAVYEFELKEAGTYQLSARVFWPDECSNSLGFEIAGVKHSISTELLKTWHTLKSKKKQKLPAGKLTLKIRNLEDGIRLDYFELEPLKK